jgi:hypothetical protein
MAHTLKAYYYTDPATAVTVDFYGAVSDNDGIAVTSYQMGIPGVEQARNNSLYSDSPRPVYSKHGTVTDVLTVDVRGSTNTNLYTNLHLLAKLGEYARMSAENPSFNGPAYLEIKPGGSSAGEVLYARIMDCRVELPPDWANTQDARLTIEDVTVTIERGLWRATVPSSATASSSQVSLTGQVFQGKSASANDIGGDTTALFTITLAHDTGVTTGAVDRAIFGFRSKSLGGAKFDSFGKLEAEDYIDSGGTDMSTVADATASNAFVQRCSFATVQSMTSRGSGAIIPVGVSRVFARMKITGTQSATVRASYQDDSTANGATLINNDSVTVSSTSYFVYDLGVVTQGMSGGGIGTSTLGVLSIDASGTVALGNLDIDWVYLMPIEGYITASRLGIGTSSPTAALVLDIFNNKEPQTVCALRKSATATAKIPTYTISLAPPPGPCYFYWLVGTDTGSVFDSGNDASLTLAFGTTARFIMPSEV